MFETGRRLQPQTVACLPRHHRTCCRRDATRPRTPQTRPVGGRNADSTHSGDKNGRSSHWLLNWTSRYPVWLKLSFLLLLSLFISFGIEQVLAPRLVSSASIGDACLIFLHKDRRFSSAVLPEMLVYFTHCGFYSLLSHDRACSPGTPAVGTGF